MKKSDEEKIERLIYRLQKDIIEEIHVTENIKEDIQQEIAIYVLERGKSLIRPGRSYNLNKSCTMRYLNRYLMENASNDISLDQSSEIYCSYLESKTAKKAISDLAFDLFNKQNCTTPREKYMIQLRYLEGSTLKYAAKEYNVSSTRAGQIISKGLRKLKKNPCVCYLLGIYLEMLDEY